MEAIYGENWGLTLAVSLVLTWGIGLAPPLLLRFVFFRRPFGMWWAIGTVSILWVFNLTLFTALGSQSKTHTALLFVALVSYFILMKGAKGKQPSNERIPAATSSDGSQSTAPAEAFIAPIKENKRPQDPVSSSGSQTVSPAEAFLSPSSTSSRDAEKSRLYKTKEAPKDDDANGVSVPEASDATEGGDDWSEEFQILNEYDPVVKECHDELEDIDPELSSQFRDEVVSDRKKATDIRDRLKEELEKKLKPYTSDELNEALAEARSLGQSAEKEFTRVVGVMGEDIDVDDVIQRLEEKYGVLTTPEDMDAQLEHWGILRNGTNFKLGEYVYGSLDDAIAFAQIKLDDFLDKGPLSKLQGILKSSGYTVEKGEDDLFIVTSKNEVSATLMADEFPRFIKGKISPEEIRRYLDYLIF